ncbi:MAG: hypothetical protein WAN51_13870, partial [Alphaproteobacteria bacterium]
MAFLPLFCLHFRGSVLANSADGALAGTPAAVSLDRQPDRYQRNQGNIMILRSPRLDPSQSNSAVRRLLFSGLSA